MKATLEFILPEEEDLHLLCLTGPSAHAAIQCVWAELFRAARKHGYKNPKLQRLIESNEVCAAIALLEQEFLRIMEEYEIKF